MKICKVIGFSGKKSENFIKLLGFLKTETEKNIKLYNFRNKSKKLSSFPVRKVKFSSYRVFQKEK